MSVTAAQLLRDRRTRLRSERGHEIESPQRG
jgi:hypothetical protein